MSGFTGRTHTPETKAEIGFVQHTKLIVRPTFVCYTTFMKSGPFLHLVSTLTGVERKTLVVFDRAMKQAGHISTSERGCLAPEMTPKDLGATLIALLATDKPARAVELFQYFAGMQLGVDDENFGMVAQFLPDPDHTFLEFMTAVCDPKMILKARHEFTITARGTFWAEVENSQRKFLYKSREEFQKLGTLSLDDLRNQSPEERLQDRLWHPGIQTSREISSTRIQLIKDLMFDLTDRWEIDE